ncbi:hypothetical protein [Cellulophaga sp. Asnod2-G02]|uniref:hypothetical protein n=1 Tax=Cellulophaga sp. Asnod2-G02 TaxID=3160572 RepID=UPI00386A2887
MKPLILDYAEKRKGDIETVYDYDFQKSLNVIEVNGEKKPFIDSNREDISLLTKTKVRSESDDDQFTLLELKTKTFVKQERDDESSNNIQ